MNSSFLGIFFITSLRLCLNSGIEDGISCDVSDGKNAATNDFARDSDGRRVARSVRLDQTLELLSGPPVASVLASFGTADEVARREVEVLDFGLALRELGVRLIQLRPAH